MSLSCNELERVGRVLSDSFGITLVARGSDCKTDGRTIYIPALPEKLDNESLTLLRAFIDHESAHILAQTEFSLNRELIDRHGPVGHLICNCLEDVRIEYVIEEKYVGCGINIRRAIDVLNKQHEAAKVTPSFERQAGLVCYHIGRNYPLAGIFTQEAIDFIEPFRSRVLAIRNATCTRDLVPLVDDIVSALKARQQQPEPPKAPKPPPPAKGQPVPADVQQDEGGGGQDEGDEGDGSDQPQPVPVEQAEADAEAEAEAEADAEADADDKQDDDGAGAGAGADEDSTDAEADAGDTGEGDDEVGAGKGGEYQQPTDASQGLAEDLATAVKESLRPDTDANGYLTKLDDLDSIRHLGKHTLRDVLDEYSKSGPGRYNPANLLQRGQRNGGPIRQRLIQILKSEAKTGCIRNLPRGRQVDGRALHKLATGTSDRVFRRSTIDEAPDTAVTLLVDQSGSMKTRLLTAVEAAVTFAGILEGCGHACQIAGFGPANNECYPRQDDPLGIYRIASVELLVVKSWKTRLRRAAKALAVQAQQALYGTPLDGAITAAADDLAKRPEKRKVLLVLTDGAGDGSVYCHGVAVAGELSTYPTCTISPVKLAQYAVRKAKRQGIEVVFVGIGSGGDYVKHLGPHALVEKIEDLGRAVIGQLAKALGH